MIAVVTGGTGFVGQNLVRRLLQDRWEVRCLVRPGGGALPQGSKRYVVQFEDSRSLLSSSALEDAKVVFHLAGATRAVRSAAFTAANVTPTRNLLGALTAKRLYPKFIFVSSQAAAGPSASRDTPIDEADAPAPMEAYGRSKLEAERVVESFSKRLPVTTIRPCSTYGPYDRAFLTLFRLADRGVILYPGVAQHWLSILHVDDVVNGLLAAARRDTSVCRTYFLSSVEPLRWRTLGEHIANAVGRKVRHVDVYGPVVRAASIAGELIGRLTGTPTLANRSKAALTRHPYWICSSARARDELGFQETRSLPDAVMDTYYWYRQNGWLRGSDRVGSAVA